MPSFPATKVWRFPRGSDTYKDTLNTSNYSTDETATDVYKVVMPSSAATGYEAANASDGVTAVPALGDAYLTSSGSSDLICISRTPTRETGASNLWTVRVDFKNVPPKAGDKWNINIDVKPVSYEQDAWFDVNNKPIVSSAYGVFNPTLKKVYYDEEISLSFTTAVVDMADIDKCKGTYNASGLTMTVNGLSRTFPAKTLLFAAPEYSTIFTGRPPFDWKVAYVFRFRKDTWLDVMIDRDYFTLDNSTPPQRVVAMHKYGQPSGTAVLLDSKGQELKLPPLGKTVTPKTIMFDMYGPSDFGGLLAGIQ